MDSDPIGRNNSTVDGRTISAVGPGVPLWLSSKKVDSPDPEGLRLGTLSTVAHPDRAKRVGDGRQGEPLAGPADGLPEARALCKLPCANMLRGRATPESATNSEENHKASLASGFVS
jgi:hypothetical protein